MEGETVSGGTGQQRRQGLAEASQPRDAIAGGGVATVKRLTYCGPYTVAGECLQD